ncbi:porin [Alphaproteobacteria bacterium]|jgi:hypothetical protein|nr:porin [Alphaproteobacteria bacterium]
MRKLLLSTTALAAAATLSANAALADVSISGYFEWDYQNVDSTVSGNNGTTFGQDSEVKMVFTNKTDSGLTIAFQTEFETEKANGGTSDDNFLSISGGFGKVVLGELDGVMDQYGIAASDLPAEEIYTGEPADMVTENGDGGVSGGESNKISYHLPAVGGLTAGVSYTNSGVAGTADATSFAARYTVDAGGATVTIGGATGTKEVSGAQDEDTQNMGVKIASGNVALVLSNSTYEDANQDESTNGIAASYKMNDSATLVGYTTKLEDDLAASGEEYTVSGVEVQYTIASGLSAVINVEDYEYKTGSSGGTNDSGTASSLTIKASF